MDKQTAAVDMTQEVMAQACTLCSTFDNTGDIRHHEADTLFHIDHTQVRIQGGKVVVGDLGPGIGRDGEQGGLTHIGETHQTHVCQQLQLQNDVTLLAGCTLLGKTGYLTGGRGKVGIAPAAAAALRDDKILAGGHIHDDGIGSSIPDNGTSGHLDDQRLAALAVPVAALAVDTGLCAVLTLIAKIQQRRHIVIDSQNDAAAMAAIAAIGAAGCHIFLPVECHRTVAASAADHGNSNFIYKHFHNKIPPLV